MNNTLAGALPKERLNPVQRVRRKRSLRWVMPWLYLLPALISIGFWVYRPLLQTVRLSFYEWNMLPTSLRCGWG
ncbi:hypothetical protein N0M98_28415 [Paenibacillus doosanensis]|uniref:hypothetical protein n=1 Tax=Paenibacillus doosanensis TaxID=1229154 RepID=UPI00217F7B73|nr:hypothetical protein [Paenibacillus doosanensis]MCS7464039.1 hypothetical protein [Paenibacillus doosanensis]